VYFELSSGKLRESLAMVASLCVTTGHAWWHLHASPQGTHGGIVMRPHRARMTDDVLCDLVFVKCNAALLTHWRQLTHSITEIVH